MSKGRRPRISEEDRRLWEQVRRTAKPLRPEPPAAAEAIPAERKPPATPAKPQAGALPSPPKPAKASLPPPAIGSLDRRTASRLSRGVTDVDARIDLHGLTQSAAHRRLLRFLEDARGEGAKIVLVITGKGASAETIGFGDAGRGILRRAVPDWLESPAFSALVSGYNPAGRRHGGDGALYVRLRRRRGPGDRA